MIPDERICPGGGVGVARIAADEGIIIAVSIGVAGKRADKGVIVSRRVGVTSVGAVKSVVITRRISVARPRPHEGVVSRRINPACLVTYGKTPGPLQHRQHRAAVYLVACGGDIPGRNNSMRAHLQRSGGHMVAEVVSGAGNICQRGTVHGGEFSAGAQLHQLTGAVKRVALRGQRRLVGDGGPIRAAGPGGSGGHQGIGGTGQALARQQLGARHPDLKVPVPGAEIGRGGHSERAAE